MSTEDTRVIALARDLMFVGRIIAEARAAGVELSIVRDPAKLGPTAAVKLLIVDLNLDGALDAAAVWVQSDPAQREVVAFVAHTDAATITRARAAGLNRVMARSAFVIALPELLRQTKGETAD
jgi:AmiR/NasT family two-component response regulator